MSRVVSRETARAAGARHYFTGEPCKNGHRAQRYVQSGACYQCIKDHTYQQRALYAAAQAADTLLPEVKRFAKETVCAQLRVPEAQAASIGSIVAAMLASHFPTLVGSGRVDMEPASILTRRAAGTCLASYLIHRDDLDTAHTLAQRAMQTFGANNA